MLLVFGISRRPLFRYRPSSKPTKGPHVADVQLRLLHRGETYRLLAVEGCRAGRRVGRWVGVEVFR
jgi:hypothetical protein